MSRYLAPLKPGRGILLWGGRLRALAAAAAVWGVARGAPVWVVDAANRFDPYQLVREAAGRGLSPQAALTGVRVARAFTSHQLVRLLTETFPANLQPGSLVLVLGPVSLFYDEQVPLSERRRLFRELVRLLARIKTQSALLLLQPLLPRAAANRHFGRSLVPVIDYFVEVESREDHRRATPAVAAMPPGNLYRVAFEKERSNCRGAPVCAPSWGDTQVPPYKKLSIDRQTVLWGGRAPAAPSRVQKGEL